MPCWFIFSFSFCLMYVKYQTLPKAKLFIILWGYMSIDDSRNFNSSSSGGPWIRSVFRTLLFSGAVGSGAHPYCCIIFFSSVLCCIALWIFAAYSPKTVFSSFGLPSFIISLVRSSLHSKMSSCFVLRRVSPPGNREASTQWSPSGSRQMSLQKLTTTTYYLNNYNYP